MAELRAALAVVTVLLCTMGLLGGCSGDDTGDGAGTTSPSTTASSEDPSSALEPLANGPIDPGRHRYVLTPECADDLVDCHGGESSAPPIDVDLTVPAGWDADLEFLLIHPSIPAGADISTAVGAPDGAALVMGWTTAWVGLNSDPCTPIGQPGGHQIPDTPVGPTVADFVDAVQAHPGLHVTKPSEVRLGDHDGQHFTLTAPSDLSGCDNWRPWDPGFYAQGPDNVWDVWVMDVDGTRVLIVAHHFPGTPSKVQSQLRAIAESITFSPHTPGS